MSSKNGTAKGNTDIAERIYKLLCDSKTPLPVWQLREHLQEAGLVSFAEVGKVDNALATDKLFRRWGRDHWRLTEWGEADVQFYPFLIDHAKEILDEATRPVHITELAGLISRHENVECDPTQLKSALDWCNPTWFQQRRGWCWSGRKDRFGAVTITDAVRECLEQSIRLLTFEEICRGARERLPGYEVKNNTVSSILSKGKEFILIENAFWGLEKWEQAQLDQMFESTARMGLDHMITAGEIKNGTFRIKAEHLPFMPGEESDFIIEDPVHANPVTCHYRPGNGYVSGLGQLYRREDIQAGDLVRFSVRNTFGDDDEPRFEIRKKGERSFGPLRGSSGAPGARSGFYPPRSGLFGQQGIDYRGMLATVIEEGSRPGESLCLLSSSFDADTFLFGIWSERRLAVHAAGPLDRLLAESYSELPDAGAFEKAARSVLDKTRGKVLGLYRLDSKCGECGSEMIATEVNYRMLRARPWCPACREIPGRGGEAHPLTPAELKRINTAEEKQVKEWHPDDLGAGRKLEDIYMRRCIHAQSQIYREIDRVKDVGAQRLLKLCFLEAVAGSSGHKPWRRGLERTLEQNPWVGFSRVIQRVLQHLKWIEDRHFYFYRPGSAGEVLEGAATFTWGAELSFLPESTVDMALVNIPSNGLKPLPDYERISAAWLGRTDELEEMLESYDLKSYFEGVGRAVKPGGGLYLVVERDPGAFRLYTEADPILRRLDFEYERTLPEVDIDTLRDRRHLRVGGPQVIVYGKL